MHAHQMVESITCYFPSLTPLQKKQFAQLEPLYKTWNERINVVSKKDIENLYIHHILHSLSIAKAVPFMPNHKVMDLGTGGGFPGLPLAILFPQVAFTLVDSIAKKIKVVQDIVANLNLQNVTALAMRAEKLQTRYDCIVTRAVAKLDLLCAWTKNLLTQEGSLVCLKGGDLQDELANVPFNYTVYPIKDFFTEPYFLTKKMVRLYPKQLH